MPEGPLIQDPAILGAIALVDRRVSSVVRGVRLRRGLGVVQETLEVTSAAGYPLGAWLHRPDGATGPLPAVVLCPDGRGGADQFTGTAGVLAADEVARLGVAALRFDPAGRGESWGDEDLSGPEHQHEVAQLVELLAQRPDIDADRIGLVGVGDGAAMAVGAAARCGAPVAWVLDYEGPSDRQTWLGDDEPKPPLHRLDDDPWWAPREAARHVGALRCPYVRLQSEDDHARRDELRHALRMVQAAEAGALPWFQINDHPRGQAPVRPWWIGPGRLRHNRALLRKIATLLPERRPA